MSTTATKKTVVNLFATGTTVKPTGAKKVEKILHKCPELGGKIQNYQNLKASIEAQTAELKMIEGDIKLKGKDIFLSEYLKQKSTPDNFKMMDESGAVCQFVAMDKYTIVDETKAAMLENFDGLVEEKIEYKFNADLVEKYGSILSQLIINCPKIADEDKPLLITGEKTFSVKKGSIDRLLQYDQPQQVFELINPILMLRK